MIDFKEICRIFYMFKGDLTRTLRAQIEGAYDSFFRRLWCNNEAYRYEEGFEENYQLFIEKEKHGRRL